MATPLSVIHAGGKVIFCDIDKKDLCLNYNFLKKKIKKKKYCGSCYSAYWGDNFSKYE